MHVQGPLRCSPKSLLAAIRDDSPHAQVSQVLVDAATMEIASVLARFSTRPEGLTTDEAGPVRPARPERPGKRPAGETRELLWHAVLNPLVILLAVLATISFATGDFRAGIMMSLMIALGVGLKLIQEAKADNAAAKLKAMISVTATVIRDGQPQEIAVSQLVPGDVVELAAGDMIPADVRIVEAKDLFVIQGSLTGESFPVEKFEVEKNAGGGTAPIELTSIAFLGTSVESGSATRGRRRHRQGDVPGRHGPVALGAADADGLRRGIAQFTWLMLRFMLVMVPLVFVINGLTKGNWGEAFFFAVAVAVGLTPEMLPMIVTVCLSKGAVAMSRKKVIVKRINAIQNLGAMDVLCTDKTGTLTMDQRHPRAALRRGAEGGRRRARAGVHEQPLSDRPEECPRPRRARAHRDPRARQDPRICQGRRDPLRLPAPHHVGRGPHARRQGPHHQQGGSRGDLPRCANFELDGTLYPMDHPHIEELEEGVRAALAPTASACWRSPPRTSSRAASLRATPPLLQGRRVRPDLERLRGVPRSAQGDGHGRHQGTCRATASRSRSSPATTTWWPARSAKRSGCRPSSCCWATRSRR